ncbi:MAG TPA: ribosome biogenesis GTPase Der [Candidatus Babeliales bacterium]|nr:ribosome biogenesis GTPase Der [Candidatus Babeliales bacterium]
MKDNMPSVVIVGRTNVGKSTLFNRLSTGTKSITLDKEGVTRDFLKDTVYWDNRCFTLIDTGGISLRKSKDPIMEQVRLRAIELMEHASLLLFVVDGSVGVLPEDRELAGFIRKFGKKIFLVANKSDRKDTQERLEEFETFGYELFPISAQHGKGIGELLEAIVAQLPPISKKEEEEEEPRFCRVALLGKPNVGKSSLMNLLLKQERSIVHDQPGTTREPISERIKFYKEDIELTDTAGVRRKRGVTEELETLMVKSSFRAVQDADIILLLVDSSEGKLSDQELKLSFYVLEQNKALILLFNKQDLATDETKKDLEFSLEEYEPFFGNKVPQLNISCKTGKNIGKVLPLIQTVWQRYSQQFDDQELSRLLKDALIRKPLYHKKNLLYLHKVKQIKTAPITILLIVNESNWFGESQLKYFENVLREHYDLVGVPVAFVVRKRR